MYEPLDLLNLTYTSIRDRRIHFSIERGDFNHRLFNVTLPTTDNYFFLPNRFFLGGGEDHRKIAWINWESVCVPNEDRGLGVRRLREFKMSLMGKWCWRMLNDKDGLWYRVLKDRYGEVGGRLREGGRNDSLWCRSVCRV